MLSCQTLRVLKICLNVVHLKYCNIIMTVFKIRLKAFNDLHLKNIMVNLQALRYCGSPEAWASIIFCKTISVEICLRFYIEIRLLFLFLFLF